MNTERALSTFFLWVRLIVLIIIFQLSQVTIYGQSPEAPNDLIAFASHQIYIMNDDGSNATQLTDIPIGSARYPAWSSDGSQLIFDASISDPPDSGRVAHNVFLLDLDTLETTRITETLEGSDVSPVWSPDGSHIVFTSNRDRVWDATKPFRWEPYRRNFEIYIMNVDGTNQIRLTNNNGDDGLSGLVWLEDSTHIVYIRRYNDLYAMNVYTAAEGLEGEWIVNQGWDINPQCVFERYYSMALNYSSDTLALVVGCSSEVSIYLIPDATDVVQGNREPSFELLLRSPSEPFGEIAVHSRISWSSDGNQIAFVALPESGQQDTEIYTVQFDVSSGNPPIVTQLTTSSSTISYYDDPAWQP